MKNTFRIGHSMDKLAPLLNHFSLHAGVFYAGNICGIHDFERDLRQGHLHLVRTGPVQIIGVRPRRFVITEPTILFLPHPQAHRLLADEKTGADVVCGTIQFGGGGRNPISDSLPEIVLLPLSSIRGIGALLDLMFNEAFADLPGRQAALDRLCEVLMIYLLRHCIEHGLTQGGTLAGLADKRLAKVLSAIHADPAQEWDLSGMADVAGMSRARFAVHFREVTGATPADYLSAWRIMIAQRLLKQGLQLKYVAYDVGYGSASALSRAFLRKTGVSPTSWLRKEGGDLAAQAQA